MTARPVFIVSSGRSGSAMMERLLGQFPDIRMHHEYMIQHIQPMAARFAMGCIDARAAREVVSATYGAAIHYETRRLWGDSSNKLSWIIAILRAEFPAALFVHVVRDGRKVASSYFNKLGAECYDDDAVVTMRRHLEDPSKCPAPPPEKRYWWPLPNGTHPDSVAFKSFGQFERIVWHWSEINRIILRDLDPVAEDQKIFVRLEELAASHSETARLLKFLGLDPNPATGAMLARPHNVNRPEDKQLSADQLAQFWPIARPMMRRLGYEGRAEYSMVYGSRPPQEARAGNDPLTPRAQSR